MAIVVVGDEEGVLHFILADTGTLLFSQKLLSKQRHRRVTSLAASFNSGAGGGGEQGLFSSIAFAHPPRCVAVPWCGARFVPLLPLPC